MTFPVYWLRGLRCFFLFRPAHPPPLSAGASLSNQTALVWRRTRFLNFWGRFGLVPAFCVLPTLPRAVPGCDLGDWATQLLTRTLDFSWSLFCPADPRPFGAEGDMGVLATPTVAQDCVTSCFLFFGGIISSHPPREGCGATSFLRFSVDTFSPRPSPLQVIWLWFL